MKIESDPNYSMTPIARRPCHRLCAGRVLPLQSRLNRPFISVSSGWQDSGTKAQRCQWRSQLAAFPEFPDWTFFLTRSRGCRRETSKVAVVALRVLRGFAWQIAPSNTL